MLKNLVLAGIVFILWSANSMANQLTTTNTTKQDQGQTDQARSSATTGNQTVTVIVPPAPRPVVIHKTVYRTRTRVKKVEIYHYNPNRLQLMLGMTKTKQEITSNACGCELTAHRAYEPDVGAQYLRDFGSFTGSIMATKNQSFYLGVGFNW